MKEYLDVSNFLDGLNKLELAIYRTNGRNDNIDVLQCRHQAPIVAKLPLRMQLSSVSLLVTTCSWKLSCDLQISVHDESNPSVIYHFMSKNNTIWMNRIHEHGGYIM